MGSYGLNVTEIGIVDSLLYGEMWIVCYMVRCGKSAMQSVREDHQ